MNIFDRETQTAIIDAVVEARILECARDQYEETNMLKVAARLAERPVADVELVYVAMQEEARAVGF